MKKIELKDCIENIELLGRTYQSGDEGLFLNWSCSGIRFLWKGTSLAIKTRGISSKEQELNTFTAQYEERETSPWFAIFLDDEQEPYQYFEAKKGEHLYGIYSCEKIEIHTITIRKITENAKGKICLKEFLTDGEIKKNEVRKEKIFLEFIGDSITCGFGNMVKDGQRLFYSEDENGWMAHPAVAARILNAEFSVISCSGIAITEGIGAFEYPLPPMKHYYPYCDRMVEELDGTKKDPLFWDFKNHIPDVIILNLGTNDATVIDLNEDTENGIAKFEEDYYDFLCMIRHYNGVTPWIICALGSMDYFLYDNIEKVVKRFCQINQDSKIRCFKYGRMRVQEGSGACNHPYVTTQIRMGEELASYIQKEILVKG